MLALARVFFLFSSLTQTEPVKAVAAQTPNVPLANDDWEEARVRSWGNSSRS